MAHGVKREKILFARNASPILPTRLRQTPMAGPLRALYVGRLSSEKRVLQLTKAFTKLGPDFRLTIVGDGPQYDEIKKVSESNEGIEMLGAIDTNRLSEIYSQHDVLALVSDSETWGVVVNEAVNHGLALLLSPHVGSAPELLDGNGTFIDELSPKAIHEALSMIAGRLTEFRARSLEIAQESTVELQATAFLSIAHKSARHAAV